MPQSLPLPVIVFIFVSIVVVVILVVFVVITAIVVVIVVIIIIANAVVVAIANCENIQSWILYVSDLVFSHQGEIYGFKCPNRFFGDLFQRSHSFLSFLNLIV